MAKIFKVPFAATGDKTVVPIPTQPDGSVSWTQGYGFDYQRKLDGSDPLAKPFPRNQHNQILNDITTALGEIQVNGFALWNAEGAPYPVNATVRYNGVNYVSRIDNNSVTPADGASWRIQGDIPLSTESVAGLVKLSTFAEVADSSNNTVAVSPQKLSTWFFSKNASEVYQGIAAIATQADVNTGTDDLKFVTPKKLSARLTEAIVYASTTVAGIIRIATSAEAGQGTNTTASITPKLLSDFFFSKTASEGAAGISAIATQEEVTAITDDTKFVTPRKLGLGFATYQDSAGGYVVFPSWLGRIIVQWGSKTIAAQTASTYQLGVSFSSIFGSVVAGNSFTGPDSQYFAPHANPVNLNQVILENTNGLPMKIYFIAIGR